LARVAGKSAYPRGNAVRRAFVTLQQEGPRSFWFKLLSELGYRRLLLFERPLDEPVPDFAPSLAVEIARLAESELDEYLGFRPGTEPRDVIERLRSGEMCFVARREGRIVSGGWIAVQNRWIDYLGCAIDMAAGDAYSYDKFTLPDYRGHGIFNAVRTHHLRQLRAVGYRRAIVTVVPENKSSVRDIYKGGYRLCGMIGRIKIGPWQRHFRTWIAPTSRD
jgi:GNAT superfamily N-acetyltransferase